MTVTFWTLVQRDLLIAFRDGGAVGIALGFYLIVVTLLPLGLGPDLNLLSRIAPGVLWIALLLAALLSLNRIFESDYDDGTLDVIALGELPLEFVSAAKAFAHWLSTCLPLALLAPILGILLNLDINAYPMLILTMLAGTPAISFLGSVGAALTLKTRRGGLLLSLLVLPLYIPTLIFGITTLSAAMTSPAGYGSSLLILIAISLASLVLGPVAAAAALRAQME